MERRVQDKLMLMTVDKDDEVRAATAHAFGEAGYKTRDVIDKLLLMTVDKSASVRAAAAIALGRLSKP